MSKKLLFFLVMLTLVAFIASGCTSSTGSTLAGALAKMFDYKTYDSSSEISMNIKYNNFPDSDGSMQIVNDMFSNISAKVVQTTDIDKSQAKFAGTVRLNGVYADFDGYVKEDMAWVKLPVFSKYLEYNMTKLSGFSTKEKYLEYQKQLPVIVAKFAKDYMANCKFKLENIKDNGNVSIKTPNGTANAREIQVTLSDEQFKEFLKYSAKQVFESDGLKNLIVEAAKLIDEEGNVIDEEFVKEVEEVLASAKEEMNNSIENGDFDEAMKAVELLNNGAVIKFYVDNSGNIVRDDTSFTVRIKDPSTSYTSAQSDQKEMQSVDITIAVKNDYWNINKAVNISYPAFNESNTISYEKLMGDTQATRMSVKDILESYKESKRRKRISQFNVGYTFATIRGEYASLRCAPYAKNNTNYVPAESLADALDVDLSVEGKTIKFTDGTTTLVMYTNSKKALLNGKSVANSYAPESKDGVIMVPLKFVAQNFKAKISWNPYSKSLSVETEE